MHFPDGLYDLLLSEAGLRALVADTAESERTLEPLGPQDSAERLVGGLTESLLRILDDLGGQGDEKTERQLALINAALIEVRRRLRLGDPARATVVEVLPSPPQVLRSVHRRCTQPTPPDTGLTAPWLFTAGKGSPALLSELRRELAAAERIDVLVSFITYSGIRKLLDVLQAVTAVGADGIPGTRMRVLTTTYTGATAVRALDTLARLPGCEVRVSLDGRRTRLHAKAWMFRRASGFGTAYVGSANLSGAALMGGLEWTLKFTERMHPEIFERAKAHFETLWEDPEFQPFDPDLDSHRAALVGALRRESGDDLVARPTFFDLEPKTYQQEMLDRLTLEREHGRMRNLVVAATGTGKTVVAAFDYRATCVREGGRPRLLFVAHRLEILNQALRTYREVLRDHSFGELLAGDRNPGTFDHLFATIDSVTSRGLVAHLGAGHWHSVVVDECHRLAADRFDALVTSVQPRILLGLTATPERSDGRLITGYFDNRADGSPAVELRLWQALDLQLLCPFEYFACDDDTDFSSIPWDQPGEIRALDNLVTGNHARARLVIDEWRRLAADPSRSRALVFCVSVAHAQFMTEAFERAEIRALCVVGNTPSDVRRQAPERLARGEVAALVTCDLYNEGVDLPNVDTLLLLRPTQSPLLFQQQLGRGLRLAPGKDSCLVLDFVGRHREDFRFDHLLSSITGLSRRQLIDGVESGFPSLPPGCHIHLARQARERVLMSLRSLLQQNWRRLRTELTAFVAHRGRREVLLAEFLREQDIDIQDIYRSSGSSGWTRLKRDAGLATEPPGLEDDYFGRRFRSVLHFDDPERLELLRRVAEAGSDYSAGTTRERLVLQMLTYQIDAAGQRIGSGAAFLGRLAACPALRRELGEIGEALQARATLRQRPIPGLEALPLCLHGGYEIREILTAVGWWTAERRVPFQAGVLALREHKTELLFVTLDKREGYHDRIAYHDYAMSPDRFHWQSQNSAGPDTPSGKRDLESPGNGWSFQLFVRTARGEPYRACGPVQLESAEGDRPMSLVWRLAVPLPLTMFQAFNVLRGA